MILTVNIEKKSFLDNHVLQEISFDVKEKEIVCLIGPSGCGKSTILNILGKLDSEFDGEIKFHVESRTGYMFQTDNLFPWKNILKNVLYGLEISGMQSKEAEEMAMYVLKEVQLDAEKDKYPHELSGGMRQRISLARTMVMKPNLLLLDEPLAHLDMISKKYLTQYIRDFVTDANIGAIIVTHSLEEAAFLADKVILLNRNPARVVEQIEFKDEPFEIRVKTLLDAIEKDSV